MLSKLRGIWQSLLRALQSDELTKIKAELSVALVAARNAQEQSNALQAKLNSLVGRECPACAILKQTVNFHVLASGSKLRMFEDAGPSPRPVDSTAPAHPATPLRASKLARMANQDFLQRFVQESGIVDRDKEFPSAGEAQ
jgi:hypothetical protein